NAGQNLRSAGRVFVCLLLGWLVLSTTLIHPDYVAYFNVLAGSHPEKVLLWGCDYDCGQDAGRLARMLREHKIEDVSLSVFTTAELGNMGVPRFRNLAPYEKAT